jgi:hypothetical protein
LCIQKRSRRGKISNFLFSPPFLELKTLLERFRRRDDSLQSRHGDERAGLGAKATRAATVSQFMMEEEEGGITRGPG